MSVMGRMVGAVVLTVPMIGRVEESAEGVWPMSMGGGGLGEGETVTGLAGVGEGGARSLTQGEVDSNSCGWESMSGGMRESPVGGVNVDSSIISNWIGMSEGSLKEGGGSADMLMSVVGTGEGAGDGGRPSCKGGARGSAKGT